MASSSRKTVVNAANFTDSGLDPDTRSTVNQVLLSNNCIPQIHATLLHECQASGFVEHVRARAMDLLRSGKATTFSECMNQIMAQIKLGGIDDLNDANGTSKDSKLADGDGKLVLPKSVVKEGYESLMAQLEPFLGFDKTDGSTA